MSRYLIEVAMTNFKITTNRNPNGDDAYFYWNAQLLDPIQSDGHALPPSDTQAAKFHPRLGTLNGMVAGQPTASIDPHSGWPDAFVADPTIENNDMLYSRFHANANQSVGVQYIIQSIGGQWLDPAARSRAFNHTVNDVEKGVMVAVAVGNFTPAAPFIDAAGAVVVAALEIAKGINNALDPPDASSVNCSGPLAAEYVGMRVQDLVNMLGANPSYTHKIEKPHVILDTPHACAPHGAHSKATIEFKITPEPSMTFDDQRIDMDETHWKVAPVRDLPAATWKGDWGETPDKRANKIECTIDVKRVNIFGPPVRRIDIRIVEIDRTQFGRSRVRADVTTHVYHTTQRLAGPPVEMADGRALLPMADAIEVNSFITLMLFEAKDRHNEHREYRIKYQRRDTSSHTIATEAMLVPAFKIM